ncbi:hypothetical protein [Streptomyces sp. NPDC051577]|uniref:hypothetical protein n=1 Tax=Streptomyces sp. NPDC051577 TaxID=3155166 RepID=UPI0034244EE8
MHPTHLDVLTRIFRPTDDELDAARAVVAAAENAGGRIIRIGDQMVGLPARCSSARTPASTVGQTRDRREVVGLGYHDLREGLVIEHRPGRTITETDNVLTTMLGGNDAPIHTDTHYSSLTNGADAGLAALRGFPQHLTTPPRNEREAIGTASPLPATPGQSVTAPWSPTPPVATGSTTPPSTRSVGPSMTYGLPGTSSH